MTNIVERLRNFGTDSEVGIWEMIDDAADTIESLRHDLAQAQERVKELEKINAIHAEANSIIRRDNDTLKSELAALKQAQGEPVAWRTFDGEGGYSLRVYEDNETYRDDYIARNGERYRDWVQPLFTSTPSIPEGWQLVPVEAIEQINKWAEAYPLDVFPEPDWKDVSDKLGRNGLLDCVSASNMRHVITKVQSMLSAAPKPDTPQTCFSAGDMADAQAKAFREGVVSAQGDNVTISMD